MEDGGKKPRSGRGDGRAFGTELDLKLKHITSFPVKDLPISVFSWASREVMKVRTGHLCAHTTLTKTIVDLTLTNRPKNVNLTTFFCKSAVAKVPYLPASRWKQEKRSEQTQG